MLNEQQFKKILKKAVIKEDIPQQNPSPQEDSPQDENNMYGGEDIAPPEGIPQGEITASQIFSQAVMADWNIDQLIADKITNFCKTKGISDEICASAIEYAKLQGKDLLP